MRLFLAWAAALSICLVGIFVLSNIGKNGRIPRNVSADAPIAFVGTSLTRNATPINGMSHGKSSKRFALSSMSEHEILSITEHLLSGGMLELAMIELRPLALDFDRASENPMAYVRSFFKSQRNHVNRGFWEILGGYPYSFEWEDPNFLKTGEEGYQAPPELNLSAFEKNFPLRPKFPREIERFKRLLEKAQSANIKLVFVDFPRAQSAMDRLGPKQLEAMDAHKKDFAAAFDIEIWTPAQVWPDDHFIDHAHMSFKGRQRFMALFEEKVESGQWME